LLRLEKLDACGSGGEVCCGFGGWEERLKALFEEYVFDIEGCFCAGCGAGAGFGGGAGAPRSKRSPMLLLFAGGLFVVLEVDGMGGDAEEKSPQSPPKLSFRGAETGCVGGDVGFAGAAGFMSKKDPPLRDDFGADGCLV
jgi:hypothetical protein